MKIYCLSSHPNSPCLVLKFKDCAVMLDCGLDMTSLQHFLPLPLVHSQRFSRLPVWQTGGYTESEIRECAGHVFIDSAPEFCIPEAGMLDLSTVDVILISSYHSMLALPYITEYSGFKGTVYATEPTLHFGRLFMEEIVEYVMRVPKAESGTGKWKEKQILKALPPPLRDVVHSSWRKCYTMKDVNSSLSKIKLAGFSEKLDLFGALQMTPLSSGYCLGSCNWIIQSAFEKVTYVSGSSMLTTHPQSLDQQPMRNSDILILTSLNQTPTLNPDSMLAEFCNNLAVTVRNGGNVLVPCYPSGVIYDLFECLPQYMDNAGLSQTPLYFVSPVADASLQFSQILAEWLCQAKQSKVYLPEPPFPHSDLVKIGRLKHFPALHGDFSSQFKTPCIVFTGHPSLRFGDAVHFMEMWGKSSANTVIFTEPDFKYLEALAPFQPLAMKACYCPIDPTINFAQASKLVRDLKPHHVVVPEAYTVPPPLQPHRTDLVIESDPKPYSYHWMDVLTLPIKRRSEQIEISPELANSLVPTEVKPGIFVSSLTGLLTVKDNKHVLEPLSKIGDQPAAQKRKLEEETSSWRIKSRVFGALDVNEFIHNLSEQGITDAKVENSPSGQIIDLQSEDTLIQIEDGSTHIISEGNEIFRKKLRDILLKSLFKF